MAIEIRGIKAVEAALKKLPKELQRTTEMSALRAGMTPVKKSAISNAPEGKDKDHGLLKKSIGLNVRKNKKTGQYTARVGPRTGFKISIGTRIAKVTKGKRKKGQPYEAFKDPTKYAHLVELGTSHSAANPFLRNSMDSNAGNIIEEMAKGYNKGLTRAIKKLHK